MPSAVIHTFTIQRPDGRLETFEIADVPYETAKKYLIEKLLPETNYVIIYDGWISPEYDF